MSSNRKITVALVMIGTILVVITAPLVQMTPPERAVVLPIVKHHLFGEDGTSLLRAILTASRTIPSGEHKKKADFLEWVTPSVTDFSAGNRAALIGEISNCCKDVYLEKLDRRIAMEKDERLRGKLVNWRDDVSSFKP